MSPNRIEGTCAWFLEHDFFRKWNAKESSNILWLTADPGCGKSVLSRALIDEHLLGFATTTICYFFFINNDVQNKLATALCAILHQLFSARPQLLTKYASALIEDEGLKLKENIKHLWDIFISVSNDQSISDLICVLDALDECGRSDLDTLLKLIKHSDRRPDNSSRVRFLITSRPYPYIEQRFRCHLEDITTIRLAGEDESKLISREIDRVITVRVAEIAKERQLSREIEAAICQRLRNTPHRTYLWLHLTFHELQESLGCSEKKLLQVIDTLPATVDQAYEELLARTNHKHDARVLLELVVTVCRPLTISEVDIALEIFPSRTKSLRTLDLEGHERRKEWVRRACGLLVSIVDNRVMLIHETARDFLLQRTASVQSTSSWKHSIHLQSAERNLEEKINTYLRLLFRERSPRLAGGICSEQTCEPWLSNALPFLEYCMDSWSECSNHSWSAPLTVALEYAYRTVPHSRADGTWRCVVTFLTCLDELTDTTGFTPPWQDIPIKIVTCFFVGFFALPLFCLTCSNLRFRRGVLAKIEDARIKLGDPADLRHPLIFNQGTPIYTHLNVDWIRWGLLSLAWVFIGLLASVHVTVVHSGTSVAFVLLLLLLIK